MGSEVGWYHKLPRSGRGNLQSKSRLGVRQQVPRTEDRGIPVTQNEEFNHIPSGSRKDMAYRLEKPKNLVPTRRQLGKKGMHSEMELKGVET